jgi:uncharacterized membrane protein YbhN (UPF0104 family)
MAVSLRVPTLPRPILAAAGVVTLLAVAAASAGVLRDRLPVALAHVGRATPAFLAFAAVAFATGIVCHAMAWRQGLRATGHPMGRRAAAARYSVGSPLNAVLPFHAGSVTRIALFARAAGDARGVGAVAAAHGSLGALAVAVLVVVVALLQPIPAWPAAVVAAGGVAAAAASVVCVPAPLRCGPLGALTACGLAARVGAASLVCHAYGVAEPLLAGMSVVAALEIGGMLPLTPGNLGVSTAATSFALVAHGLPASAALPIGLALPAIETVTSILTGMAGLAVLANGNAEVVAGRADPAALRPDALTAPLRAPPMRGRGALRRAGRIR